MERSKVGELGSINVSITLWFVLTVAVIAVLVSYFIAPQYRDQIKFVAVVLGGAATIYSAYFVGAALRLRVERDRLRASFEFMEQTGLTEFTKVRKFLEKETKDPEKLSAADLYTRITDSKELEDAVTVVFNVLETISVAVQHDYADENVLYLCLKGIVTRDYHALRGYIDQLRKSKKRPELFTEIEKMANAWDKGRRLWDGRSFPPIA